MPYFFILFFLYLAWKYIFHDREQFPSATTTQKVIHSLAIFYAGWICWGWIDISMWIVLHPHGWIEHLQQKGRAYPIGVDIVFQLTGAIIGLVGPLCCYFVLRGYERARRVFFWLLPFIFAVDCYSSDAEYIRIHHTLPFPVLALGTLFEAIPFLLIFVFYRHPRVIESLFTVGHRKVQANEQSSP